ncbi:helix-turn-helix domain-containing protein [Enterococcus rotai]|uniref:helix-turn-helix domain-containing protein n=1 Tax=Enterococcus rotai TaxID=118060 RepID=UPI0032B56667
MKLFIGDIDNRKVRVLDYLIKELKEVNISDLVAVTGYSDKTVRTIILSLKDNPCLDETKMKINYNERGKIISIVVSNISLSDAAFFYLEKSVVFIMIKELFIRGYLDKNKICSTYFISEATYSRYKQKLNKILARFYFKLSKENVLIGEEYRIRNFYFLFFSYMHSKWYFSEETYRNLDRSLDGMFTEHAHFDSTQKKMLCLLIYIVKIRNNQGFVGNQIINIEFKENGSYERIYKDISTYINTYCAHFENKVQEIQFIFFFVLRSQIVIPETYLEKELIIDLSQFDGFEESRDYLTEFILLTFFEKDLKVKLLIEHNVTTFLLYAFFCFVDSRAFLYVYDEANYYKKTKCEKIQLEKIETFINLIEKEFPNNLFVEKMIQRSRKEVVKNQLFLFIQSLLARYKQEDIVKIRVYVQNSKVYVGDILKSKIKQIFADNVEIANRYDESIELIVSDKKYTNHHTVSRRVYVPTFSDSQYFTIMCEMILKELMIKMDQNKLGY